MENVGFALALIGFLLATGVWLHSAKKTRQQEAEREKLAQRLEKAHKRSKTLEEKSTAAMTRVQELEHALAEAVARRDEKAMAAAMWELELERSYRQWHDVVVPSTTARADGVANDGQKLSFAISHEVDRLREEVGVSIRFDGGLDLGLEAEVALGMLRIGEELLALAARRADEVAVSVDQTDDSLIALTLVCQGWEADENPQQSELAVALEQMASKLEGTIAWQRADDNLRVTVQLPTVI